MMTRRGFLGSIIAMAAAPAIVHADSIMRIWVPKPIIQPAILYGDGIHNDLAGLTALVNGNPAIWADGSPVMRQLDGRRFILSDTLYISPNARLVITNCHFTFQRGAL